MIPQLPNDILFSIIRQAETAYGGNHWRIHKGKFSDVIRDIKEIGSVILDTPPFDNNTNIWTCCEEGWGEAAILDQAYLREFEGERFTTVADALMATEGNGVFAWIKQSWEFNGSCEFVCDM